MRVFLTGATGYIGSAALDALVRAGHQVTCLVRSPEKAAVVGQLGGHPVDRKTVCYSGGRGSRNVILSARFMRRDRLGRFQKKFPKRRSSLDCSVSSLVYSATVVVEWWMGSRLGLGRKAD